MKSFIFLILLSTQAFADYHSEKKALDEFEENVFLNDDNYSPAKPGAIPMLNKEFFDSLNQKPQELKYFVLLSTKYRILNRYRTNKPFALYLESKFEGKELTKEQKEKVVEAMAQFIYKDSNFEHKRSIASYIGANAYFEINLKRLDDILFK